MAELHRIKMDVQLVIRAYNDEHVEDKLNGLCDMIRMTLEGEDKEQAFDIFQWKEIPFEQG